METWVGVCSPAHIGVQLDKIPPRVFLQRMKHHLDINLAGEERGMKKEGACASGDCLGPSQPRTPTAIVIGTSLGWMLHPHCRDGDIEVPSD